MSIADADYTRTDSENTRTDTGSILRNGKEIAVVTAQGRPGSRRFLLRTNGMLREGLHAASTRVVNEVDDLPHLHSGSPMLDGLYSLAVAEAVENAVSFIRTDAFNHGNAIALEAFETGEKWTYVWTRDLSYSVDLALASFDPARCASSLFFKTSTLKDGVTGGFAKQILQDTGTGGSYPVSTDRVVWAIAAARLAQHIADRGEREAFVAEAFPFLHDTIEQDRRLVFDPADGLYRGEQSFLDWREQTYPGWTRQDVLAVARSKSLSTNVAHFAMLRTASDFAGRLGRDEDAARFARWAAALKDAINLRLYDPQTGLYCAYLLEGLTGTTRVDRYDLLGIALAVLWGVADEARATRAIAAYPAGPHGPPVVWPQEQTVPIYHNHGIWPFVTVYWVRAARRVRNFKAFDLGLHSLVQGAAMNLSNMENLDFATGDAYAEVHGINGPVISSQRQLWSVAGFMSLVQDGLFGFETGADGGVRFAPFVTAEARRRYFSRADRITLRRLPYRGTQSRITVHLPEEDDGSFHGPFAVAEVRLNGRAIDGDAFVPPDELAAENSWEIRLQVPAEQPRATLRVVRDFERKRAYFGPVAPAWRSAAGGDGITVDNGRLTLHYHAPGEADVTYNIYRDGVRVDSDVRATTWTDPLPVERLTVVREYAVEAVYPETGNHSHLSPTRLYLPQGAAEEIPAGRFMLADGRHPSTEQLSTWGGQSDELRLPLSPTASGNYLLRLRYANGWGTATGIACAVKRIEVTDRASGGVVAGGYVVMPQTRDPKTFVLSSGITAALQAGADYVLRLFEDSVCRNMTYLKHNEMCTLPPATGGLPHNRICLAAVILHRVNAAPPQACETDRAAPRLTARD